MDYKALGGNGGNSYKHLILNDLQMKGMRFEHCYSNPLCTPSRVQLMTGKYSFSNYIGFGLLDPSEKTFGHYMKQTGYKTFVISKWQLLGNSRQQKLAGSIVESYPEDAGFDDYCLWQIDSLASRYKDPLLSIKGPEQGFDCYIIIYKWNRDKLLSIRSRYIEQRERALDNRQSYLRAKSVLTASEQNELDKIYKQQKEIEVFKQKNRRVVSRRLRAYFRRWCG